MELIATKDGYELHATGKQGYQLKEIGSDQEPILLDSAGAFVDGDFRKLSESDLVWARSAIAKEEKARVARGLEAKEIRSRLKTQSRSRRNDKYREKRGEG